MPASLALSTCKSLARAAWTRTRALAHPTIEHAAHAAGVDRSHLSRWESERCDHPASLAVPWKARGGYGSQGATENLNRHREVLWLSPACLDATRQPSLFAKVGS